MPDLKRADAGGRSIKVGVIADQTGPLSVMGLANANVARMVIGDLNAKGGLLGRHVELCLEDSETNDLVAAARATKLVEQDRVDVVFTGCGSAGRAQALGDKLHGQQRRVALIEMKPMDTFVAKGAEHPHASDAKSRLLGQPVRRVTPVQGM